MTKKKPRIFDPSFRYTPANSTDIRKTFAKVRRELKCGSSTTAVVKLIPTKKLINKS